MIRWALKKKGVMEPKIRTMMKMYTEVKTSTKLEGKMLKWCQVKIGVYQGSVRSPLSLQLL